MIPAKGLIIRSGAVEVNRLELSLNINSWNMDIYPAGALGPFIQVIEQKNHQNWR